MKVVITIGFITVLLLTSVSVGMSGSVEAKKKHHNSDIQSTETQQTEEPQAAVNTDSGAQPVNNAQISPVNPDQNQNHNNNNKCPPGFSSSEFYKHGECFKKITVPQEQQFSTTDTNQTRIKIGQDYIKECNEELGRSLLTHALSFMDSVSCINAYSHLKSNPDGGLIYRNIMNMELALGN